MSENAPRLGQLLITAGLIDETELQTALQFQAANGGRLGEALLHAGRLTEAQMTQVLSNQLSVAWVSLDHVHFNPALLALVPAEMALRHLLIPVHSRCDTAGRRILYLAMEDPTNIAAMHEVSAHTDMHVRPMITTPTEMRLALDTHYSAEPVIEVVWSRAVESR